MAGSFPAAIRNGSPIRCNEKPWDFWVSELGRSSPLRDEDAPGGKGSCRRSPKHNGITRLKHSDMSLYGEYPSSDSLTVAVCHMCDTSVKLTAVHRHWVENHSIDSILPPPPPAVKHKSSSKSKHKYSKDQSMPMVCPMDIDSGPPPSALLNQCSVSQESTSIPADISQTVTVSVPHIVLNSSQDVSYYPDMGGKCSTQSEVKVSLEENDLPVVSIQDNTDLPLADDIIEIMNSEGIQSIEDIPEADTNAWKNLIQDFGALQDMTLQNASILSDGSIAAHELYDASGTPVRVAGSYSLAGDSNTIQYTQPVNLQPAITVDGQGMPSFPVKPIQCAPVKPSNKPKAPSKGKTSKFQAREYDPNKHCGVMCADSQKPCTRSLTCKAHTLSLRRQVDGRIKSFDALLAEHRAAKQATLSSIGSGSVSVSGHTNANHNTTTLQTGLSNSSASGGGSRVLMSSSQPNTLVNQNGVVSSVKLASQANNINTHSNVISLGDLGSTLMGPQQPQTIVGMGPQPTIVSQMDLVNQVNLTNQMLNQQTIPPGHQLPSPIVMSSSLDMNSFSELDSDRQVSEYYNNVMSSVSEVIGEGTELLVDGVTPSINVPPPRLPEPRPGDVYWYPTPPRPLASCTFSTYQMGNALVIGKRLGTVRSNFKTTLMRPHTKNLCNNFYNFSQNSLTSRVNKNMLVNNSSKPEVRKLIMSCPELMGATSKNDSSYFNSRQNGHLFPSKRPLMDDFDDIDSKCMQRQAESSNSVRNKVTKHSTQNDLMEFMSVFDPLIADEKC